ncbi:glycoside hydrolase [Rhizoclosmatium globosum]|uniref:Glycoside hydrolase n=1 Tax=Rhizoclosmatium globosum TaxID=329046 RepID=A0A1Y2CQL0_9FUNG|nr:glycoside hydrolase [Rhizoclosmatium globosum]|eukprot:ORY49321.1 glycoside hydrolase [Rhizoclosmatium globosum]
MNGEWFPYGQKPDAYKAFWIKVYTIFQTTAPHVAFVWSPNFNGPANNEPYDPYWPGADYVDWVGLSVYWKGRASEWPWLQNTEAPLNYVSQIIDAQGPEGGPISFYQTYAVQYSKPMVISEAAGAFHMGIQGGSALDVGVGREKTLMSFWNSFLFSPGFFQTYPLVKMIFAFEMYKVEDGNTQNDYRATMDLETRKAFVAGLQQLDSTGAVAWASLRNLKRDKTSSSIPLPKQALAAWSILGAIF